MILRTVIVFALIATVCNAVTGGNPDRVGEAGAYELLINPWARGSALGSLNTARVEGLEAMRVNAAGLAFTKKTEIVLSHTRWLAGSDIGISALGFAQKFKETNSIGLSIVSMNFGQIERTTTSNPEGGVGLYRPQFLNIGLSYAKVFSNSIYGGVVIRGITEAIDDLRASGACLDAGIQYVTGKRDNVRIGISLRNVGTPMSFSGDGLGIRGDSPEGNYQMAFSQKANKFELPSTLSIGASYDFYLDENKEDLETIPMHRLTVLAAFISHSFGFDQFGGGLEYGFREMFMLRAGYRYEKGITKAETRASAFTGLSMGVSFEVPVKKGTDNRLGIDYSYVTSNPFNGNHNIGLRFKL